MSKNLNILNLLRKSCDNLENTEIQKRDAAAASSKSDAKKKPVRRPKDPKKARDGKKSVLKKPTSKKGKDKKKSTEPKPIKVKEPELPFNEKTWHLDKVSKRDEIPYRNI